MRLTNDIKNTLIQKLLEASPLFAKARQVVADRAALVEEIRQALLKQYDLTDEKIDELKASIKENGFLAVNVSKRDELRVTLKGECRVLKMNGLDESSYRDGKYVGPHTLQCLALFNSKISPDVTKKYVDHNRSYITLNEPGKLYDRLSQSDSDIESLSREVVGFRRQVKGALSQVTTVKKLKEVWPEAVPYLPELVKQQSTAVALPVETLNAICGLPK